MSISLWLFCVRTSNIIFSYLVLLGLLLISLPFQIFKKVIRILLLERQQVRSCEKILRHEGAERDSVAWRTSYANVISYLYLMIFRSIFSYNVRVAWQIVIEINKNNC